MIMDELEELRRRKMQEYLAMQEAGAQMEQAQRSQALALEVKKLVSQVLANDAIHRLSNIRAVKPDLAYQIDMYLLELYRAGRIKKPLSDTEFKAMLGKMIVKNKPKITRISK